ncbi:hypothetical protein [Jiulongibacter sediminis]|mgnify:CR=1 FL=1|uniref:hypothetical protein n=1 Tax=Jiulongibacter sediminis TaxID=1605367 RepID=UPI0026F2DB59|nr:hypothetical protein [Jiulongibacter sediminis]
MKKLSTLQLAYKNYFLNLLSKYSVDSPARLTVKQKSEFFSRIKKEWPTIKAELNRKEPRPIRKKIASSYAHIKSSKPPVAMEPIVGKSASRVRKAIHDSNLIHSEPNPKQVDDLKINFFPNDFFEQEGIYKYPVVKMPKINSPLKLPRNGRSGSFGFKEKDFYLALKKSFTNVEVRTDLHMAIPYFNRPYEPDIVLIDHSLNLYIDIEIDEPYDGYFRFPTHEAREDQTKKDDTRDLFFTESGWVVIRFTERQIHLQEQECLAHIRDVYNSIRDFNLEVKSNCQSEPQWDYQQSIKWEKARYREKYLDIEGFDKQKTNSKVVVDPTEAESIERSIERTQIHHTSLTQDNIAFEDEAHVYHHPKDATGNAEYLSVTTLIDRFFPFDLNQYIMGKARKEGLDKNTILKEFILMRDEAAAKGTELHELIENHLKGSASNAEVAEYMLFKDFQEEVIKKNGFVFVEAEKRVLLEDFNLAGTIDALFKKPDSDEYIIFDWKRSKKLVIDGHPKKYGYGYAHSELNHLDNSSYYKYALQQNIYKYILEREYGLIVSSINLIVLHENYNTYHRVKLDLLEKEVEVLLNSINHKI